MALRRLPWLGCVVLVVAFSHTGRPAHAQSLVDAARLAREIREALGPPTKVYTNQDLPAARRITEPTLAWVSRYHSLLEAALERERALLEAALERERALLELRRDRPLTLPVPVPVQTVPQDPAPTPPTFGIPLYPLYLGYPVFVSSPLSPRPRHSTTVSASPRRHRRGSRARDRRSRVQTARRRPTSGRRVAPFTRRPAAGNGYEQSRRSFPHIAPGLTIPGAGRHGSGGRASGATRTPPRSSAATVGAVSR